MQRVVSENMKQPKDGRGWGTRLEQGHKGHSGKFLVSSICYRLATGIVVALTAVVTVQLWPETSLCIQEYLGLQTKLYNVRLLKADIRSPTELPNRA
jgi:hypothetical protein